LKPVNYDFMGWYIQIEDLSPHSVNGLGHTHLYNCSLLVCELQPVRKCRKDVCLIVIKNYKSWITSKICLWKINNGTQKLFTSFSILVCSLSVFFPILMITYIVVDYQLLFSSKNFAIVFQHVQHAIISKISCRPKN
jgi:hypothetical protein